MNPFRQPRTTKASRRGITSLEVLVAFTLLSGLLAVSTSLVVTHGRLLSAQQEYRVALDELSNQMERLTALTPDELPAAVGALAPSEMTTKRLKGVELAGELQEADVGQRIVLRIWWDEPQRREAPVQLAAWAIESPAASAASSEETP